jgi:hypothetical protein
MSLVLFIPYIICRANETAIKYPPKSRPINTYSPTAFLATLTTFSFYFIAVLDRIKAIRATNRGIRIMARVKLKFSVKRENKKIPLGLVGVS